MDQKTPDVLLALSDTARKGWGKRRRREEVSKRKRVRKEGREGVNRAARQKENSKGERGRQRINIRDERQR